MQSTVSCWTRLFESVVFNGHFRNIIYFNSNASDAIDGHATTRLL